MYTRSILVGLGPGFPVLAPGRKPVHFLRAPLPQGTRRRETTSIVVQAAPKSAVPKYQCEECGARHSQMMGMCPKCREYGTVKLAEVPVEAPPTKAATGSQGVILGMRSKSLNKAKTEMEERKIEERLMRSAATSTSGASASSSWFSSGDSGDLPESLERIGETMRGKKQRFQLKSPLGRELNRIFGGGLNPESCVLIAGSPGIGKSTMLLQLAAELSSIPEEDVNEVLDCDNAGPVLYISGEESKSQIYERANRIGLGKMGGVVLWNETSIRSIAQRIEMIRPRAIIVDSIQRMYLEDVTGTAGSVSQIKECAAALNYICKLPAYRAPVFLIGHVNKEGGVAGPRVLEHLVDVTLYVEGDREDFRLLKSLKNRFGPTDELVVLRMEEKGLQAVADPWMMLVEQRKGRAAGASIIGLGRNGRTTVTVELEALVGASFRGRGGSGSYEPPTRVFQNISRLRVPILLNALSRFGGVYTGGKDVFVQTVGGLKAETPDFDLPIALSIASSVKNVPIPLLVAAFGEIRLTGDLQPVRDMEARVKDAARLGFKSLIVPRSITSGALKKQYAAQGLDIHECSTLRQAIQTALNLSESEMDVFDEGEEEDEGTSRPKRGKKKAFVSSSEYVSEREFPGRVGEAVTFVNGVMTDPRDNDGNGGFGGSGPEDPDLGQLEPIIDERDIPPA